MYSALNLRSEQVKKTPHASSGSEDGMPAITRTLLAVKKVDKKVPVIQQSLLIGSLLEHLCSLYESDEAKSKQLYYALCEQLSKWNIISPVAYLEEFASVQTQYRSALYKMIQSSLSTLDIEPALLPTMLDSSKKNRKFDQIIVDRDKVFNFEKSRYRHEFNEIGKLGNGGYGNVFRAKSKIDGQEYAIKKILLRNSLVDERNDTLLREVRVLAGLRHKNIVQYHSAWVEHEDPAPLDIESGEESSLESGVIPFTPRRTLPQEDSFHLESSEEEASFENLSSGAFADLSKSNGDFKDVIVPYKNTPGISHLSKFWGESSSSDATTTQERSSNKIHFTISSAESDIEPCFEDGIGDDSIKKVSESLSPPKEVIMTDGVRKALEMHRVKSVIFSNTSSMFGDMLKSPRNRSFSSIGDRELQNADDLSRNSKSGKMLKLASPLISGTNKLVLFMQMQLCQMSLKHWLSVRNKSIVNGKKFFHESTSFHIMKQIAAALLFVHSKNLIHRDVKPANIFLNNPDNPHVMLGDFGLAKSKFGGPHGFVDSMTPHLRRLDSHTSGVGTTSYAAPEQLCTDNYDAKADMYSLGIVVYELWTVFSTAMERARQIKWLRSHHIPRDFIRKYPEIGKLVVSLLHHDPQLRPSSADLHKIEFFDKSKDRVIEDQLQKILSLENEVDQLKLKNKKLTALLEQNRLDPSP